MRFLACPALALVCLSASVAKGQVPKMDLRDLRVGMTVAELPRAGYTDFQCLPGRTPIAGWQQYRTCAPNDRGLREVAFRYANGDTEVAGQPVLLSLGLNRDGVVQQMTMRTDPSGRVFLRKRGFRFGERVMAHYGETDWQCLDLKPSSGERPVGHIFVRQHCEKTVDDRHLVVDRSLFREPGQNANQFTSASSFTVSLTDHN